MSAAHKLIGADLFCGGRPKSIDEPLPTVTSKDRLGLVEPAAIPEGHDLVVVDILFRMLQPNELARAMGFEGYEFSGSHADQVKMIGNAVPVRTAKALVGALLHDARPAIPKAKPS